MHTNVQQSIVPHGIGFGAIPAENVSIDESEEEDAEEEEEDREGRTTSVINCVWRGVT